MNLNSQNNTLDKIRKDIVSRLKRFDYLSKIRNIDFPMNHISIVENNLIMINEYYKEVILGDKKYNPKLDMWLITLIINYVSSVKAYLNRKIKKIEQQRLIKEDKDQILAIIRNYRKKDRNETPLDHLVRIRDRFEHEEIKDISLTLTFKENGIQKKLFYQDADILNLFILSFQMLKKMNQEIAAYIEETLVSLDLRQCALFMNAFNRHFNKKPYTLLMPDETESEMKQYDKMIVELISYE